MKLRWKIWIVASVAFFIYCALGYVASRDVVRSLRLTPNQTHTVELFSFAETRLGMDLWFKSTSEHPRPELGEWSPNKDNGNAIVFDNPGEPVDIEISANGISRVYSAMPKNGQGAEIATRSLVPKQQTNERWDLSLLHKQSIPLKAGFSTIDLKVLNVGQSLQDENIEVYFHSELSFKTSYGSWVDSLWFYFLWPLILPALILWGVILLVIRKINRA